MRTAETPVAGPLRRRPTAPPPSELDYERPVYPQPQETDPIPAPCHRALNQALSRLLPALKPDGLVLAMDSHRCVLFIRVIANCAQGLLKHSLVSTLRVSVAAGESGPILTLSGEADITNADQLRDAITAQLASGTVYLTIDAAELNFADSGSIGILAGAAKSLKELGGGLVLLRPQNSLVRTLILLGVDQVLTIHGESGAAHERDRD